MPAMGSGHVRLLAGLFMAAALSYSLAQRCDEAGWFGPRCEYRCHCTDNRYCDTYTGKCMDGVTCERGWFGPSCQYVDIAINSTVTSSGSKITEMTDGDDKTCRAIEGTDTLTFELSEAQHITWLRLRSTYKDNVSAHEVGVQLRHPNVHQLRNCTEKRQTEVNGQTLDIYCSSNQVVEQVVLTGDGIKSLCTVHISGQRNIALRRTARQSSTVTGSVATFAVDGDVKGLETCSRTESTIGRQSWSLNFQMPQIAIKFVIRSTMDGDAYLDLKGFLLECLDSYGNRVFTYRNSEVQAQVVYTLHPLSPVRPFTSLQITAIEQGYEQNVSLTLCEVEVYGESFCTPDRAESKKYGRDCENECFCNDPHDACFPSTGNCPSGCKPGFHGDGCRLPCLSGHYGVDCKLTCSHQCQGRLCDAVTGACNRCPSGSTGPLCDEWADSVYLTGLGVAVFLLIVLVAGVFRFYWYRKKLRQKLTEARQNRSGRKPGIPDYSDVNTKKAEEPHDYKDLQKSESVETLDKEEESRFGDETIDYQYEAVGRRLSRTRNVNSSVVRKKDPGLAAAKVHRSKNSSRADARSKPQVAAADGVIEYFVDPYKRPAMPPPREALETHEDDDGYQAADIVNQYFNDPSKRPAMPPPKKAVEIYGNEESNQTTESVTQSADDRGKRPAMTLPKTAVEIHVDEEETKKKTAASVHGGSNESAFFSRSHSEAGDDEDGYGEIPSDYA